MEKLNEAIENIFSEVNILGENGSKVPVVFANYTGVEEKTPPAYIVYTDTGNNKVLKHGGGRIMLQRCQYEFVVYTKKRSFNIIQQLVDALKRAGFYKVRESADGFDNQFKYYFKSLIFSVICNEKGDKIYGKF